MDLKAWDQEVAAVYQGLVQAERSMAVTVDSRVNTIAKLKAQISRYHGSISQDLENIIYLASPKNSLRALDRSLLYWASKYSSYAQKLIRETDKKTVFAMWLKLVQSRLAGHATAASWSMLKFGEGAIYLRAQRRKDLNVEADLRKRLADLDLEKAKMTERYNALVLTRANRDAAGCLQMDFGSNPAEAMKHPLLETIERLLLNGSLRIRKSNRQRYAQDSGKLNQLTQFVQEIIKSPKPTSKIPFEDMRNKPESFEVLSDRLMGINPLRDSAISTLGHLQTKRANSDAAEINLQQLDSSAIATGHRSSHYRIEPLASLKPNI